MTISHYAVVRYLPDPLREEFINIGVVVISEESGIAQCRFTSDWHHKYSINRDHVDFLKEFAEDLSHALTPQGDLFSQEHARLDKTRLEWLAGNWMHAIQFSEVRASVTDDPAAILDQLYTQFVARRPDEVRRERRKTDILTRTQGEMKSVLRERFDDRAPSVTQRAQIKGQLDIHSCDLAVWNGRPWIGLNALTFRSARSTEVRQDMSLSAWAVKDVHAAYQDISMAVVLIREDESRNMYERAESLLKGAGATILQEGDVTQWANDAVNRLPDEAAVGLGGFRQLRAL